MPYGTTVGIQGGETVSDGTGENVAEGVEVLVVVAVAVLVAVGDWVKVAVLVVVAVGVMVAFSSSPAGLGPGPLFAWATQPPGMISHNPTARHATTINPKDPARTAIQPFRFGCITLECAFLLIVAVAGAAGATLPFCEISWFHHE